MQIDNTSQAVDYIKKAIWKVAEDIEQGCIACLKANDADLPEDIWDAIFDGKANGVNYRHVQRFSLPPKYNIKYAHLIIFYKDEHHAEAMEQEVLISMRKLLA